MKIIAILVLLVSGCKVAGPTFEAYSVPLSHIEKIAETKIPDTGLDWKMVEYLLESGQMDGPNFADRYTLFSISCGTGCTEYVIIDRISGAVYPGESITLDFPSDYRGPYGLDYRRDSRLLVIYQAEGFSWPVHVNFYVWDGAKMKFIKKTEIQPNQARQTTTRSSQTSTIFSRCDSSQYSVRGASDL